MTTAIIDYGSGNLHSAQKAFERSAREAGLEGAIRVTNDPEVVRAADRVVLPGVGAFADCRGGLLALPGLYEALHEAAIARGRPFLGICVGMQLMAARGLEHGETPGLDWIGGDVVAIKPADLSLKIPHMGWNTLSLTRDHPVFSGIPTGEKGLHAYFVHSYHLTPAEPGHVLATTDYGAPLTASVARDNLVGVQFHPEKSQRLGLALIANFLRWRP
ncbi:MAG: imidazole glycerol phosphate synthase subunit HisH [Methylocystis sp.]